MTADYCESIGPQTRVLASVIAVLGLIGVSCGSDNAATPATPKSTTAATTPGSGSRARDIAGEINVFAAASLTAAFDEMGKAFSVANPDATVTFNYAGSSDLVAQIAEGAPADVFASADQSNMKKLTDAGNNASAPVVFATNLAEVIVEKGNPKRITGVSDLSKSDLIVVLCADEVPCGKYATTILKNANVTLTPKSLEQNVKAVVAKVTLGEADAGIVYKTDVTAAGEKAEGVAIPEAINVVAQYPIAVTKHAKNPDVAQAFIDFVNGEQGQKILASYGFLAP